MEDEYPEEAPPDASVWESRSAGAPVFAGQPELALRQQYAEEPTEEDTPADVKRVVTATGKIVEVDIDPDEDPLTRKRIERRLAEREAAKSGPLEGGPAERGRLPESDWSNREYEEGVYEQRTRERSSGLAEGSRSLTAHPGPLLLPRLLRRRPLLLHRQPYLRLRNRSACPNPMSVLRTN